MCKARKKILWLAQTAVLLALLICLQWLTKPLGQLVTGSAVNTVLAIAALFAGTGSGIAVALLSPVFAYLFGIAPQLVTVPAIMAGNAILVVQLALFADRTKGISLWNGVSVVVAAASKATVLYLLVVQVICGFASAPLLEQGLLKKPMLTALPTMFSWMQLVTALIGCALALLITPVLRKALKR